MRHVQVGLTFLGIIIIYSLRVNLSVVIVAMAEKKGANPKFPEYNWNVQTQALILSGLYWGFVLLQVPGGLLSEKYGPKTVITVSHVVTSLFSVLTPAAAELGGWGLVFACRFIQGLGQGLFYPATHVLLARWVPVSERGTLVTVAHSASQLGTVLSLTVCGVMATSSAGWPSTFYLFGGLGLAYSLIWLLLGANSPAEDRFISAEERAYIEDSLKTREHMAKPLSTPWKAMLTSRPVWAIIVAECGWLWGYFMLLADIPTYIKTALEFDLHSNGFFSALPYLVMWLLSIVFSFSSDYFINHKIMSTLTVRKLYNCIGLWIPSAAFVGLSYSRNATIAIALLSISVGVNAAVYVGHNVNYFDLAPNYAGTLFGIANCLSSFIACFGPLVVGALVTEHDSVAQWRIVFFITAGVYFLTGVFYVVFAKAELQWWNDVSTKDEVAANQDPIPTVSGEVETTRC